jgi:hypothetical protein
VARKVEIRRKVAPILDHRLHIYVCICKTLRHYKLADPAPLVTPVVLLLTDTNIIWCVQNPKLKWGKTLLMLCYAQVLFVFVLSYVLHILFCLYLGILVSKRSKLIWCKTLVVFCYEYFGDDFRRQKKYILAILFKACLMLCLVKLQIIFVLDHRLHIYVCICKTLRMKY